MMTINSDPYLIRIRSTTIGAWLVVVFGSIGVQV